MGQASSLELRLVQYKSRDKSR